jgi:peroxiredoxin
MKIYVYILGFLILSFCIQVEAANLTVGKVAPAFEIKTISGASVTPSSTKGRILIVNFWATWCAPCQHEMPELEKFYRKYHDQGVDVVAISLDDKSDLDSVKSAMKSCSFPFAMADDADMHRFGRIWRVPVTFVIDRNGVLRHNGWEGEPLVDASILENIVLPLLTPATMAPISSH